MRVRKRLNRKMKPIKNHVEFGHPEYKMRRGKHRGVMIKDLPTEYVDWCATNMGWGWAKDELSRRYCSFED